MKGLIVNCKTTMLTFLVMFLVCGIQGISYAAGAPTVKPGDNDTELIVQFSDFFSFLPKAYEVMVRRKTPPGDWKSGCTEVSVSGSGHGTVTITISGLEPGTTYQVRYRDTNELSCFPFGPAKLQSWSPIGEGTTSSVQVSEPSQPVEPDLVVETVEAVPSTAEPEETFKLYATLKNQGTGESTVTVLRYYRSMDAVISTADTQQAIFLLHRKC